MHCYCQLTIFANQKKLLWICPECETDDFYNDDDVFFVEMLENWTQDAKTFMIGEITNDQIIKSFYIN